MERVAYTPKEFAALFGKSQTWGYRKIYSGAVASTTEHGRTLIPATEVQKILGTAQRKGVAPPAPASKPPAKEADKSLRSILIRGSQNRQLHRRGRAKRPPGSNMA